MLETVFSTAVCTVAGNELPSPGNLKPQEITDGKQCIIDGNNPFLTVVGRKQGSWRHTREYSGIQENSVLLTVFLGLLLTVPRTL